MWLPSLGAIRSQLNPTKLPTVTSVRQRCKRALRQKKAEKEMGKETAQAAAHTENKQTELERDKQQRGRLGRLTRRICSVRVYEYVWGGKGEKYIGILACVRLARVWRYISSTSSGACKCEKNKYKKIKIKKGREKARAGGDGRDGETK